MGFQPSGGAKSFLELTDVLDTTFTAKAGKVPMVNVEETALELLDPQGYYPIFPDTQLYQGTKSNEWETLDCGVGKAFVFIKCEAPAGAGCFFRQKGETHDSAEYGVQAPSVGAGEIGYAWCPTDINGCVEWKLFASASVYLWLIGYVRNPTLTGDLIYDGLVNQTAWVDLNTLVGRQALVQMQEWSKETSTEAISVMFKPKDWTPDAVSTNKYCCAVQGNMGADKFAHVFLPCKDDGLMRWMDLDRDASMTIRTLAMIVPIWTSSQIFSGIAPTVWTELATGLSGKHFVLIELKSTSTQTMSQFQFRPGGETNEVGTQGGSNNNYNDTLKPLGISFAWLPTDAEGKVEWKCGNADITAIATLRAYL